jgi:hypothetical protein
VVQHQRGAQPGCIEDHRLARRRHFARGRMNLGPQNLQPSRRASMRTAMRMLIPVRMRVIRRCWSFLGRRFWSLRLLRLRVKAGARGSACDYRPKRRAQDPRSQPDSLPGLHFLEPSEIPVRQTKSFARLHIALHSIADGSFFQSRS